jgi:hypothetical protein
MSSSPKKVKSRSKNRKKSPNPDAKDGYVDDAIKGDLKMYENVQEARATMDKIFQMNEVIDVTSVAMVKQYEEFRERLDPPHKAKRYSQIVAEDRSQKPKDNFDEVLADLKSKSLAQEPSIKGSEKILCELASKKTVLTVTNSLSKGLDAAKKPKYSIGSMSKIVKVKKKGNSPSKKEVGKASPVDQGGNFGKKTRLGIGGEESKVNA